MGNAIYYEDMRYWQGIEYRTKRLSTNLGHTHLAGRSYSRGYVCFCASFLRLCGCIKLRTQRIPESLGQNTSDIDVGITGDDIHKWTKASSSDYCAENQQSTLYNPSLQVKATTEGFLQISQLCRNIV